MPFRLFTPAHRANGRALVIVNRMCASNGLSNTEKSPKTL